MIGKTLGSYEIQGMLGKGGMGEVYKAKDARLGRTVAIKVLPKDVSEDAEVKERFTREARMISPLGLDIRPEPAELALSPDGTRVAFSATDSIGVTRIWVRELAALDPSAVPNTDLARQPFWSPDGRHLGFFSSSAGHPMDAIS